MLRYLKFLAEVLATILAGLVAALAGDDAISVAEGINVLILALGAVAVLGAGNLPAGVWAYTKSIVAAATAGAVVLASAITDGVTTAELLQVLIAAVGAVGVFAVKGPRVQILRRGAGPQVPGVADHAAPKA